MLTVLREKKILIGWAIVIFFALTMISGSLLFSRNYKAGKNQSQQAADIENAIALIDGKPIDANKFSDFYKESLSQLAQFKPSEISPDFYERLQYDAFSRAVRYTILLEGAREAKIRLSRQDVNGAIQQILTQYDLKDKRALKKILKENDYPYDDFIKNLQDDLLVKKFTLQLEDQAALTDETFNYAFKQIQLSHILISNDDMTDEEAKAKADEAMKKITEENKSFSEVARTYSSDNQSAENGGDLGWFDYGQDLIPDLENVAFGLQKGQLAGPIKTSFGYHIIKVTNVKSKPVLESEEELAEQRNKLEISLKRRAVDYYVNTQLLNKELDIKAPSILAYHSKIRGNAPAAIGAYQLQISQDSSSPKPHYFIGSLLFQLGNTEKAKEELEAGAIKSELSTPLPDLHIKLAQVYDKLGNNIKKLDEFNKAIEYSKDSKIRLQMLSSLFANRKETALKAEVDRLLKELELKEKQASEEAEQEELF